RSSRSSRPRRATSWAGSAWRRRATARRPPLKSQDDQGNPPDGVAGTRMWMALTYHKLNQPEEARHEYNEAEKWLAQFPDGMPPDAKRKRLELHLHNWRFTSCGSRWRRSFGLVP